MTPEQIGAFWAAVTGVTAVVTGVVAILSLRSLKQDSIDRTRPVISAELLPVVLSKGTTEIVVANVGRSVAKQVNVTLDPPVTEDMGQMAAFLANRYKSVIPTMGPGRQLGNIYARWVGDGSSETVEPVPQQLIATITYEDSHGRSYMDRYELTLESVRNETVSSPSNTDEKGLQKRLANALEAIARGIHRR